MFGGFVKKGSLYTVFYAAVLGIICAVALTAVDRFTDERKAANAQAEEVQNILTVLGVPFDAQASASDLLAVYESMVGEEEIEGLEFFVSDHPEAGKLRAMRFHGPGLWGPIEGLICLEEDMRTVYAISFYRHEETPGLGGEISSAGFQDQFRGKVILGPSGDPGIHLVNDGADQINEIDAITGATMTCDKVEDMLSEIIERIIARSGSSGA